MNKESFEKFHAKYTKERDEIREVMGKLTPQISNLKKSIEEGITFSSKLTTVWTSSPISTKEKLQKLLFPEGIIYSKKNEGFRTEKVNSFFSLIAGGARLSEENKKGTNKLKACCPLQRRVRDSNPRTCNSQQFSRLPQSTALPSLRGKSTF